MKDIEITIKKLHPYSNGANGPYSNAFYLRADIVCDGLCCARETTLHLDSKGISGAAGEIGGLIGTAIPLLTSAQQPS